MPENENNSLADLHGQLLTLDAFSTLSAKDQEVIEVLTSGAGTQQAAFVAVYGGYKTRSSATSEAHKFFSRPEVKLAVKEMQALRRAQYSEIREQLVADLIEDVSYDPGEAYDANGVLKPIPEMPLHLRKRITGIKETKYGLHIEFVDRMRAKAMLMQMLGIEQQSQGMTININLEKQDDTKEVKYTQNDENSEKGDGGLTLNL